MKAKHIADTIFQFANQADVRSAALGFDVLVWSLHTVLSNRAEKTCRLHAPPDECWRHLDTVEDEQRKLRRLLNRLAERGVTAPLWRTLRQRANANIEASAAVWIGRPVGQVEGFLELHPRTIEAWYSFALAELIAAGFGDSVKVCEKTGCSILFLESNRSGRPRRYCSPNHASQARVVRKRKADKRRRRIL